MGILDNIGNKIRYYRKVKKLTQDKLAELSGLSIRYIGYIERGEKRPSIDALVSITKALNVRLKNLFDFEEVSREEAIKRLMEEIKHKDTESILLLVEIAKKIEENR